MTARVSASHGVSRLSSATTALTYNDQGQVLAESYSGGTLGGITVSNNYDALLRRTGLVSFNSSGVLTSDTYGYDAASRLSSISAMICRTR